MHADSSHAPDPGWFPATVRRVAVALAPAAGVIAVQLIFFPVPLGVWLQGIVLGALNAMVVLGLMLVYRANRVVNLAQASIGAFPASLAIGVILLGAPDARGTALMALSGMVTVAIVARVILRADWNRVAVATAAAGVFLAVGMQVAGHAGYLGGVAVGLVTAVLTGAGIDAVVVNRFRRSPRLVLTVATIGLAQFFAVWALLVPRLWHQLALSNGSKTAFGVPGNLKFTISGTVFHGDEVL